MEDLNAVGTLLARLLLLEPGTFQSHPEMGVGLVSKYRYTLDRDIDQLRNDFSTQIAKYLPQLQAVKVSTGIQGKLCYIAAFVDGDIYNFLYDSENNELKSSFRTLNEL